MKNKSENINKYLSTFPFYKKRILCKAPFNSLRLTLNGNIQVCCANKEFVLGKYPEISIKDAWFGEKINQLRKSIKENDLSLGCNECKAQIEMGAFSSFKAHFYDHLKILKNGYPSLIEFELDNTCNLECIMCNPDTSSAIQKSCNFTDDPENPYGLSLINELEKFIPHLTHANFIGGEPFLIPIYYSIIEEMLRINQNIRFNISTNGTVLNDKIRSLINNGYFDISVSIDSIKKETFEMIRKNSNFDSTLINTDFFHEYCNNKKTYFSVWVCPIEQNAYEIPDIMEYFDKKEIPVFFNTVTMPHTLSLWYKSSGYLNSVSRHYEKNRIKGNSGNAKRFNDLISQIKTWEAEAGLREATFKPFLNYSGIELKNTYIQKVKEYICNHNEININIENLISFINNIIADKSDKQLKEIFFFLFSLPFSESVEILLSKNRSYINYYINKNF